MPNNIQTRVPVVLSMQGNLIRSLSWKTTITDINILKCETLILGDIPEHQLNHDLICDFITQNYPTNIGVYFNIPTESTFMREFVLPFTDKNQVKETIPFELSNVIVYPLDEIVFDYYSYPDYDNNITRVVIVGCLKNVLYQYLSLFKKYNIFVLGLYAEIDSLYHLGSYIEEEHYIALHVSSNHSYIIHVSSNEWLCARNISLGYNTLIKLIAEKWGRDFTESADLVAKMGITDLENVDYGHYKNQYKLSKSHMNLLIQAFQEFSYIFQKEINVTINSSIPTKTSLTYSPDSLPIILSSDLKYQSPLETLLSHYTNRNIVSLSYEKTPLISWPREYTLPFGSIIAYHAGHKLRFLDKDLKKYVYKSPLYRRLTFFILFAFGLISFIGAIVADLWFYEKNVEKHYEANVTQYKKDFGITRLPKKHTSLVGSAQKQVNLLKKKTDIFTHFFQDYPISLLLLELTNSLPVNDSLVVNKIRYDSKSISVVGSVESVAWLEDLQTAITKNVVFATVNCSKRTDPGKNNTIQWKFKCQIIPSNP